MKNKVRKFCRPITPNKQLIEWIASWTIEDAGIIDKRFAVERWIHEREIHELLTTTDESKRRTLDYLDIPITPNALTDNSREPKAST